MCAAAGGVIVFESVSPERGFGSAKQGSNRKQAVKVSLFVVYLCGSEQALCIELHT
jgi:hypothetical protein